MTIGLGIIADDFTGGLMVATYMEHAGISCAYIVDPAKLADIGDCEVAIFATRARFIPAAEAVALVDRLTDALAKAGCRQVFYKVCATFDSTDDGNIGPIADLLAAKYNISQLIIGPGFPDFRATIHQGYLFYRDRLVSESIKRLDPITPMTDPDLVRVLQRQTKAEVGLLRHSMIHKGLDACRACLQQMEGEGIRYVITDCVDNDDIAAVATLAQGVPALIGADALGIRLAIDYHQQDAFGLAGASRPPVAHARGPGAVLVGSVGPTTMTQLANFEQLYPVLRIDLLDTRSEAELIEAALAWAAPLVGDRPMAVTTACETAEVEAIQAKLGILGAARKAERLLAGVAVGLKQRGVRRFVVAGGETSGAVVSALGIRDARIVPSGELGFGYVISDGPEKMSLFLKPGKIGADDVYRTALDGMS
jgi:uncharacterized protein YgbK (DUF1537 family)